MISLRLERRFCFSFCRHHRRLLESICLIMRMQQGRKAVRTGVCCCTSRLGPMPVVDPVMCVYMAQNRSKTWPGRQLVSSDHRRDKARLRMDRRQDRYLPSHGGLEGAGLGKACFLRGLHGWRATIYALAARFRSSVVTLMGWILDFAKYSIRTIIMMDRQ
jgi:hypothetical protein